MTGRGARAAIVAGACAAAAFGAAPGATPDAAASPRAADLRLRRPPTPIRLRMRPVAQAAPAATAAPDAGGDGAGDADVGGDATPGGGRRARDLDALLGARAAVRQRRDDDPALARRVRARIDVGLGVDGARLSQRPTLDGHDPRAGTIDGGRYESVRTYGFGEVYVGSRGIGAPSLSTYFASQVRAASQVTTDLQPVMSPYDRAFDLQARSAWIESDGLFTQRWLAPLRVRAGRQFIYGPAIVHTDALLIAWEARGIEVSTWAGARVADYDGLSDLLEDTLVEGERFDRRGAVAGTEVRVDLRRWKIPVLAGLTTLRHGEHAHDELSATLVPHRDVVIRSSTRLLDRELARQRLVVRARLTESSTVMLDGQLRTGRDWMWDYSGLASDSRTFELDAAARRYLDLGPVRPRVHAALQAGTVLFQNIDLLARGAIALDLDEDRGELNPHLPSYVEGGAGIEVRLRRALALQASVLVRDYARPEPGATIDVRTIEPQRLPARARLGEESVIEGGVALRYTAGARKLSAHLEVYGRQTTWAAVYRDEVGERIDAVIGHGGGRFWIDAWVNPRVRLRTEYDLSTRLAVSPEIRGVKTLRVLLEGTY